MSQADADAEPGSLYVIDRIAGQLPASAHNHTYELFGPGRRLAQRARWTTPAGLWTLDERTNSYERLTLHGPDVTVRLATETAAANVVAVLRALGALS